MHPLSQASAEIAEKMVAELIDELAAACLPNLPDARANLDGIQLSAVDATMLPVALRNLIALECDANDAHLEQMRAALSTAGELLTRSRSASDAVACANCGAQISGLRFSRHLQSCMLGKGRAASRAAQQSLRELASYS